jgi:hypothetical protein
MDGPMSYNLVDVLDMDVRDNNDNTLSNKHEILGVNTFTQKHTNFSKIYVPFNCKLLVQELEAMGVSMKIVTEGSKISKKYPLKNTMPTKTVTNIRQEIIDDLERKREIEEKLGREKLEIGGQEDEEQHNGLDDLDELDQDSDKSHGQDTIDDIYDELSDMTGGGRSLKVSELTNDYKPQTGLTLIGQEENLEMEIKEHDGGQQQEEPIGGDYLSELEHRQTPTEEKIKEQQAQIQNILQATQQGGQQPEVKIVSVTLPNGTTGEAIRKELSGEEQPVQEIQGEQQGGNLANDNQVQPQLEPKQDSQPQTLTSIPLDTQHVHVQSSLEEDIEGLNEIFL